MNEDEFNRLKYYHDLFRLRSIDWLVKERQAKIVNTEHHNKQITDEEKKLKKKIQLDNRNQTTIVHRHIEADDFVMIGDNFSTYIDWKTTDKRRDPDSGSNLPNLAIDAVEFACHYIHATVLKCNVIFAYWDPFYKVEKGFFLSEKYKPRKILFPKDYNGNDVKPEQANIVRNVFPNAMEIKLRPDGGSFDPFILIDGELLEIMNHWHDLMPVHEIRYY